MLSYKPLQNPYFSLRIRLRVRKTLIKLTPLFRFSAKTLALFTPAFFTPVLITPPSKN